MKFSYFKKKLIPEKEPYYLVGFGKVREPKEDFFGLPELWLKICRINDGETDLIFIALDTLYFSKDFTENIFKELSEKYGLKKEQVIFNASHTHSAPNISINWDQINREYTTRLESSIYEGIEHCINHLTEGFISIKKIQPEEKLFVSRRKKARNFTPPFRKIIKRLPNFDAPIDEFIRIITLYDQTRKPVVIMYNISCHPVFNRSLKYSSDFVGVVSSNLEQEVDMAMFIQGFSGDVRARFYGKLNGKTLYALLSDKKHLKRSLLFILKILVDGTAFIPYQQNYFSFFTEEISKTISKNFHSEDYKSNISISTFCFNHNLISESGQSQKDLTTHIASIDQCVFISIPAEVNSSYYNGIRNVLQDRIFFPMGCGYDMIGYLPSSNEVDEGGYEVSSFANYGWDAQISKESIASYEMTLLRYAINTLSWAKNSYVN